MAEFHVPTEGGKVSVRLDSIPKDPAERDRLIDEKLSRGEYTPLPNPAIRGRSVIPDPAEEGIGAGALSGTMGSGPQSLLLDTAKRAAPAVGGGLLGGAVGTLVGGPVGGAIGGSIGAMGGEAVTQYGDPFQTGHPPDWRAIPMAGAVPGASTAITKGIGNTLRTLPGVAAGRQQAFQRAIGPQGAGMMRPTPPSAPLWAQFDQAVAKNPMGTTVSTGRLNGFAQELRDLGKGDAFGGKKLNALATKLEKLVGQNTTELSGPGYVPIPQFRQNMTSLGAEIAAAEKTGKGGAALGKMKQLYGKMWDELDDAILRAEANGDPVASILKQAITSHKHELAQAELSKIYTTAMSYSSGQRQVDPNVMLKRLDDPKSILKKWLPADEIQEIKDILKDYGKVPKIPSQNEQGGNFSRLASALGPDQFAAVMGSRPGRRLVRGLVEHEAGIEQGLVAPLMQVGGRFALNSTMYPPQVQGQ